MNETEVFDEETLETILASGTGIRGKIHESAISNIRKTQYKQKTLIDAIFPTVKLKWEILSYYVTTQQKKRQEGKKFFICIGWSIYIISKITPKGVTTLKNETVRY